MYLCLFVYNNHSDSHGPSTGRPLDSDNTSTKICTSGVDCACTNGEDRTCNVKRENKPSNGTQTCDKA